MLPIGRAIQAWRAERGWTQEKLSHESGVPRPNLSLIEQGARDLTLSTLRRLAQALGVRPGILADGAAPSSSPPQKWTRENLDRIARALSGLKTPLNVGEKKAAAMIRPLISQKMRLKKIAQRGARREKRNLIAIKQQFEPAEIKNLLNRVEKLSSPS